MSILIRICPMRNVSEVIKYDSCSLHAAIEKWPSPIKGNVPSKNLSLFPHRPEEWALRKIIKFN